MAGVLFLKKGNTKNISNLKLYSVFGRDLELITNAPDCFKAPGGGSVFELFAQTLDVNVDRSAVAEIVEAPDLVKKLVARENAVVVGGEEVNKLKLSGRKINRLAANLKLVFAERDLKVIELYKLAVGGIMLSIAAKHRLDACEDLLHIQGLDDKVVCAELET